MSKYDKMVEEKVKDLGLKPYNYKDGSINSKVYLLTLEGHTISAIASALSIAPTRVTSVRAILRRKGYLPPAKNNRK